MPAARNPKLVAIRVSDDLAKILESMPDKSEFIRAAIAAKLGAPCPACGGTGLVFPKALLKPRRRR